MNDAGSDPDAAPDATTEATPGTTTDAGPDEATGTPTDVTTDAAPDAFPDGSDHPREGAAADPDATDAGSADVIEESSPEPSEGGAPSDVETSGAAPPSTVLAGHLRLWLTADQGVTCVSGRVTRWADQSGNQDDAVLLRGQLGPRCQVQPTPHVVSGVDLPYFSAPPPADGGFNVVDETLDVDLGFLAGSDYTIFAVERRWADPPPTGGSEIVLGTTVPPEVEAAGWGQWCNPDPQNEALALGYLGGDGGVLIGFSQGCTGGLLVGTARLPAPPPADLGEETISLDQSRGHEIWSEGVPVGVDLNTTPLTYAASGAIGRGDFATPALDYDVRFRGDIAEVVVYDAALNGADRGSVEQYLRAHWRY